MLSSGVKCLINRREILNGWLDSTEVDIMDMIRENEDPTEKIYYRETLKSRLHDIQLQITELLSNE